MAVSKVRTSAGTTLSIASAPATYDLTGFAALVFTPVGEVTDMGSFGKKYNLVSFNPLGDRKTVKRKSSYNNGLMTIKMGSSVTDAGQVLMQAAADNDASQAIRVVTQSGSTFYFTAQVMGWMLAVGNVGQIMGADADLELDNDIVVGSLIA